MGMKVQNQLHHTLLNHKVAVIRLSKFMNHNCLAEYVYVYGF